MVAESGFPWRSSTLPTAALTRTGRSVFFAKIVDGMLDAAGNPGAGAEMDLEAIWDYIAQDSLDAADRWIEKEFEAFEVSRNPP
jgi:hypothetical protein